MSFSTELAAIYHRDLTRLLQEISAFPDQATLWATQEGIANSAGHLALHLEGNLREYIGRQLGNIPYTRDRHLEFTSTELPLATITARIEPLPNLIAEIISGLSPQALESLYPEIVLNTSLTTQQFLLHLLGHLNYHLGQIDYLRRIITKSNPVSFAAL